MKINVFVQTGNGSYLATDTEDNFYKNQLLEDRLIQMIDERDMSSDEILVHRFKEFLSNKRINNKNGITVEEFEQLPEEQKQHLRVSFEQFLENYGY